MSISHFNIVSISGSLRKNSFNTALMHAVSGVAPENMKFSIYDGLENLPHFHPEHDHEDFPVVRDLRTQLKSADGILLCTPEYAGGVPGVLKNALDWVVSSGETATGV